MYLNDSFHANKQLIGLILSGYTLTALIIRPFGGFMVDSFPRKAVLLICYFAFFAFFAGYLLAGTLLMFGIVRTMHGFAFGSVTVANSTVAIDIMPSSRRGEGIGYYGISNNIAMAIGPSISLYIYSAFSSFDSIFWLSLISSGLGLIFVSLVKPKKRDPLPIKGAISLDRFFLTKGTLEGATLIFFSIGYSILSTYLAIYARQDFGEYANSGLFFMVMAIGLILSRLFSSKTINKGFITKNVTFGMTLAVAGYFLFVTILSPIVFYLSAIIIGLGFGSFFPSYQSIFINLAPHNQRGTANSSYLTSWDIGVGIGVMLGGYVAEHTSYHGAFWMAAISCLLGALMFYFITAKHFNKYKLR